MSHSHNHNHSHNGAGEGHSCPSHNADAGRLLLCAALTGGFMVAEIIGGYISGSLALIADAGHMLTDFAALIAAYIGVRLSQRGGKKAANYIALGSGISLLLIAIWIGYKVYDRLGHPHEVMGTPMLIIASLGLLVNILVFSILIKGNRDNLNMRGAVLHVMADMLGSLAAIIAAIIILTTGYMPADPILSALVAILIVVSAIPLIRDSLRALRAGA
ncbi:MAG: cation diffusion facilitator family transporter [Robiginitomaculum sp.]